jgi:hypothetical protein
MEVLGEEFRTALQIQAVFPEEQPAQRVNPQRHHNAQYLQEEHARLTKNNALADATIRFVPGM